MLKRLATISLLASCSPLLWADDALATKPARGPAIGDVLQWSLALLIVLLIFAVLVWLLRKSAGMAFTGKPPLALLGGLSLGLRERVVLVKVGDRQLLLGVTPGRIDKLLELEGEQRLFQHNVADDNAPENSFAHKLQQLMQGRSHD